MHTTTCVLTYRASRLLALRLSGEPTIFPTNSRFPRLCTKCYGCLSTGVVYCSRCIKYRNQQAFKATEGLCDYAPNDYSRSNGWSVFCNFQLKDMTRNFFFKVDLTPQKTQIPR